MIAYCPL